MEKNQHPNLSFLYFLNTMSRPTKLEDVSRLIGLFHYAACIYGKRITANRHVAQIVFDDKNMCRNCDDEKEGRCILELQIYEHGQKYKLYSTRFTKLKTPKDHPRRGACLELANLLNKSFFTAKLIMGNGGEVQIQTDIDTEDNEVTHDRLTLQVRRLVQGTIICKLKFDQVIDGADPSVVAEEKWKDADPLEPVGFVPRPLNKSTLPAPPALERKRKIPSTRSSSPPPYREDQITID